MTDEKISGAQAVTLLFLSQAFNTMNDIPAFHDVPDGMSQLWGAGIALLIQLAALAPALLLERRYPGQNAILVGYGRGRPLGTALAALYAAALFVQLAGSLTGFEYFLTNAVYPDASILLIVLTMCATCFWASRRGLQGLARSGTFICAFFLVSLVCIAGGTLNSVDLLHLRPDLTDPVGNAFRAGLSIVARSSELYLLPLLLPHIRGGRIACALGLVLSGCLFRLAASFLITTVLGEFGWNQAFPYYTLASVSDLSIFQRLDALHMAIWTFIAFVRLTLLIQVVDRCLKMAFPLRTHPFLLPALFVLTAAGAVWLGLSTELIEPLNSNRGIVVLALTAGVPLLLLLLPARRRKTKEGCT